MGRRTAQLFIRAVCLVGVVLAVPTVSTSASATSSQGAVEDAVLDRVNAGSPGSFERHSGLVGVARNHSKAMAARRQLSHDGADDRPESASPDPAESNGAPDDGHRPPSTSCENVGYVFQTNKDPAAEIHRLWQESPPHKACLDRTDMNVAGVGVYFDGDRWWATFVAMSDRTPPSGKSSATPTAEPKKDTVVQPTPAPDQPEPEKAEQAPERAAETEREPIAAAPTRTKSAAEAAEATEAAAATEPETTAPSVGLPPHEQVVAQAPVSDVVTARAKVDRLPVPKSVLIGVIVLAMIGIGLVLRSGKQQPVERTE